MKRTLLALMLGSSPLLWTSCGGTGPAPAASETVTHSDAEQALFSSLNAARKKAGKAELKASPQLSAIARGETAAAAASGKMMGDNTNQVRDHSSFGSIGKLYGQLTDRGPRTGATFVEYWLKQNHTMIEDDWSHAGVGISRTPSGQLLAVVLFGGVGGVGGGGMLMQPIAR